MVNKNCCNDYRYISGHIPYTHIPNGSSAPRIYFFDLFGQVVVVVSRFRGRQSTALPECLSWEFQSGRLWTSLKPSLPISSTKKDLQKSTRTNPRYWIDMIGFRRMHKGTVFSHAITWCWCSPLVQRTPTPRRGIGHGWTWWTLWAGAAAPDSPSMAGCGRAGRAGCGCKDEYTNWTKKEQACWSVDLLMICWYLPSGKLTVCYWKWP